MLPDVDDWLVNFLERHAKRYRPFDWPTLDTDEGILFLEVWSRALRDANVNEADADEASIRLGSEPPRYRSDHLPAVLKAVREIRAERSSRCRIYEPGATSPAEPIVWPEGVAPGDMKALWRHLAGEHGTPNIRRVAR